ncbi:MAG TPA: L-lysine 6-transaminase [Vicinamibacteria bacterium]|nr:L-lysine 6-transaminase [Vicinamibacteria bacterium]
MPLATTLTPPSPAEVHEILARHTLADGFDIVFDIERSHGAWLHDARAGRDLLDFCSFFGSNPIGHNHPKMKDPEFVKVLHRVSQVKPSLSDFYSVEYAWFVDIFGRLAMPAHMRYAFFVEGGTLGVENALKTAFDWKVRRNRAKGIPGEKGQQVIHFKQAFHGRSGYTLSLTNTDSKKTAFYPKFKWPRIDNPGLRFPVTPDVEAEVAQAEERALDQVERAFADNPDDIAAIIIEPIQAEGGDIHFRPRFLQALQRKAREHDAFFVLDEVQTGVGLTGKMWAHEHFGLEPDAVAFGKKLQVCGCMVGPRVDEEPENVFKVSSRINSTWGGGLTDMVRAARYLEVIHEDRLVDNSRVVGERLLDGLRRVQSELGGVMTNARGRGLMIAFDLETPELRDRAQDRMLANGLLLLGCGVRSIRFRPPLDLSAAEADAALGVVRKSLKEL